MVLVPKPRGPALRPVLLVAALAGALLVPAFAEAGTSGAFLANPALGFSTALPPAAIGTSGALPDGRVHVAQSKNEALLLVRIQDLEDQVRALTGRVEGLEFQLTQMAKQAEDNEFRFQQLEGGTPAKKPQAAVPTDSVTPSDALPQDQDPAAVADQPAAQEPAGQDLAPLASTDLPMDGGLGDSQDPLLGGGIDQLGTLSDEDQLSLDQNRPLDLSLDGGPISSGDAKAQYAAGYDAITRGDYAFAEDQFQQFVALYPDDPQAPDATNWLGEALIQRGAYTDAAQVLADGYTRFKDSKRAPDMMLKLGVALAGADQGDVACRTFFTLKQRYPDLSPAFRQRLAEENQKAKCPVS